MRYEKVLSRRRDVVVNNAGGIVFRLNPMDTLRRFLVTGTTSGTYYVNAAKLTEEAVDNIKAILLNYPEEALRETERISRCGLGRSNDTCLLVLALAFASGNRKASRIAEEIFPSVVRTGTHMLHFASMAHALRSFGRSLRRTISRWYSADIDRISYQITKYRNRDGWSHLDVLALAHVRPATAEHEKLFKHLFGDVDSAVGYAELFKRVQSAKTESEVVSLIREYKLEREFIPSKFLRSKKVWEVLYPNLQYIALMRNLGVLSNIGLTESEEVASYISKRLADPRRERVHPLQILSAWRTYSSGHGHLGDLSWEPHPRIVEALEAAFYASFESVEYYPGRLLVALDVSGSMDFECGVTPLTCREVSAVMSMIAARKAKDVTFVAFCDKLTPLEIDCTHSLDSVLAKVNGLDFGGTNCSLPALWALHQKEFYDGIVIYTDNETWCEREIVPSVLRRYRSAVSPACRQVVVGMVATNFTIADPQDLRSLDVAGFSADTPQVLSWFLSEEFRRPEVAADMSVGCA